MIFYRICELEVSNPKSMNKYLEPKNIQTMELKTIVLWLVKREYFFWSPGIISTEINDLRSDWLSKFN